MADRAELAASITIAALEHTSMRPEEVVPMYRELMLVEEPGGVYSHATAARPAPPLEPDEPQSPQPPPEEAPHPRDEDTEVHAAAEPPAPAPLPSTAWPEADPVANLSQAEIDASHGDDFIRCLECGKDQRVMSRHLERKHGLTPDQYRDKWGLPEDYPLTAPATSRKFSERTKQLVAEGRLGQAAIARKRAAARAATG